jgi:transglutaminase-like putative cysteine protease
MKSPPVKPRAIAFEQLLAISVCMALALLPHLRSLPVWLLFTVAGLGGIRLALARRGNAVLPRGVKLAIAALAIGLLFLRFRTFNGLSAGTALLALTAGLKLLETHTRRDFYVLVLIIYFLSMSILLEGDSFWLLTYVIGVGWLTTAVLLRVTTTLPAPGWPRSLRYTGRILAQALPIALAFWLLFPRFSGPLWHMPDDGQSAESGLSDSMSPGDITALALSDEIAFRVRFAAAAPPANERYWRGPVMHDFDGHTWTRGRPRLIAAPTLQPRGRAYQYTLSLEPNRHNWIFALDWPTHWNLPQGALTSDYTLVRPEPVSRPIDVAATSYTDVQDPEPLNDYQRRRDVRLPQDRNPRTLQLAQTLRRANPDDREYVRSILDLFSRQAFYYTLTPPKLSDDSVDEFLFETKRGFCGHYASAFATLMRAAGIPARVVTGYQGGTFNRFANYWIVRQSDAHAWDEVWIEGQGWLRVDPTSVIAPGRVERGLNDAKSADSSTESRWQYHASWLADTRLRLDALRVLWRERILLFDDGSQIKLLEWLHIPAPDGQRLVMVLAAALLLVFAWLTWQVRREIHPPPKELLVRAYAKLCAKMAAVGLPRLAHEGCEDYAARIADSRPDLEPAVDALCRQYSRLRYSAAPTPQSVGQFDAAVRAFHPSGRTRPARRLRPPGFRGS